MVHKVTNPKKVQHLFTNWQETVIWSALQGIMGDIYAPDCAASSGREFCQSAMVILGDFCYFAGEPNEELVAFKPADCTKNFLIMVPENEAWGKVIESHYKEKATKITRYAIYKDRGNFNKEKLQQTIEEVPKGCQLRLIDRELYERCLESEWSRDFVANYKDYEMFEQLGLGVVMVRMPEDCSEEPQDKGGEIIAGASSYSTYKEGIEIEIVTREDCRQQGLAYICASKLILECLERKLYPSWDARTKISVALAEKLGYEYSHEYVAYDIVGY